MSQAFSIAHNLAQTLMVPVVVFEIDGQFGVMEASEYDGDPVAILHEFDPHFN